MPGVSVQSDRGEYSFVRGARELRRRLRATLGQIDSVTREERVGKALFYDEVDKLTPQAQEFFVLLADMAGMGKPHFSNDPLELASRAGHRELALRIAALGQIDGATMEKMTKRYQQLKSQIDMMENDDE